MKAKIPHLILAAAVLLATDLATHAATVLVDDDFSTSSINTRSRFNNGNIDSNQWIQRSTDGPNWSISGGVLTNPASTFNDEKGVHRMDSVNTAHTAIEITVSFDYSVGAGSTLYYHSALFSGSQSGTLSERISQANGSTYITDWNAHFPSSYKLQNGTALSNSVNANVASFVGGVSGISGTYTATFDIRGYGGGGFDMTDVSHVLNIFTSNNDLTGGSFTIDNFLMTAAPEPSSTALLGLGLSSLLLCRRRS